MEVECQNFRQFLRKFSLVDRFIQKDRDIERNTETKRQRQKDRKAETQNKWGPNVENISVEK